MSSASGFSAIDDARNAIMTGHYQQAYHLLTEFLATYPDNLDAYFLLSRIAYDHKNFHKEVECLAVAHRLDPRNPIIATYLARALVLSGDTVEALWILSLAEQLEGHTLETYDMMAVTYNRLNRYAEASSYFAKVIALGGTQPGTYFNLASTLKFCGDFDGARNAYEKAIELKPDYIKAHAALTSLGGITESQNHIERLGELLRSTHNIDDALCVAHALSKEHEALNNFDAAYTALDAAKQKKISSGDYNFSAYNSLFSRLHDDLASGWAHHCTGYEERGHIFVVGMPRTGTTLVERILSSHSRVATGGELYNFSTAVKKHIGSHSIDFIDPLFFNQLSGDSWYGIGKHYCEGTRYLKADKEFLVDKLPPNALYAGMIARALPHAKIVILDRHPLDTIMSNYRQLFSFYDTTFTYTLNLLETAKFYVQFRRFMDECLTLLPDTCYSVNYEALVAEPSVEVRKLLDFCGLEWQESCVNIEQNRNPVATASAVQVRQPISVKSVGQWRHYTSQLQPVVDLLRGAGIAC